MQIVQPSWELGRGAEPSKQSSSCPPAVELGGSQAQLCGVCWVSSLFRMDKKESEPNQGHSQGSRSVVWVLLLHRCRSCSLGSRPGLQRPSLHGLWGQDSRQGRKVAPVTGANRYPWSQRSSGRLYSFLSLSPLFTNFDFPREGRVCY